MTFVGKVLVVVQLVLAVCFMAFAGAVYTAQENWREKAKTEQANAQKAQQAASAADQELQKTKTDLGGQINDLKQQFALLQGKFNETDAQLKRTAQELQDARTAVDRQTAVANLAEEAATARQEETLRQRERNERLQNQINDLLAKSRGLEDTLFSKNLQIEQMEGRQNRMIDQLAQYRQMIIALNGSPNPEDYRDLQKVSEPPPKVDGLVLNTQASPTSGSEFVEVSLGSDDGFKKYDTLVVYRGSDYLGKIELTDVHPDRSVGRVTYRTRNGTIKKGDHVTPKL
jgi:hypothetical protein